VPALQRKADSLEADTTHYSQRQEVTDLQHSLNLEGDASRHAKLQLHVQ